MVNLKEQRKKLETTLRDICNNVYYQPPESVKMTYPAIVLSRDNIDQTHADNIVYRLDISYQIKYITRDPDDQNIEKLALIPRCRADREFKADGLYHYVYTIRL